LKTGEFIQHDVTYINIKGENAASILKRRLGEFTLDSSNHNPAAPLPTLEPEGYVATFRQDEEISIEDQISVEDQEDDMYEQNSHEQENFD
jgi:hypothetical protein